MFIHFLLTAMIVTIAAADQSVESTDERPSVELTSPAVEDPNPTPRTSPATIPPNHKLIIGDWIAQWDTKYGAWFYYNINTETSTWIKPAELDHVVFRAPEGEPGPENSLPRSQTKSQSKYVRHQRPSSDYDRPVYGESEQSQAQYRQAQRPKRQYRSNDPRDKIFVENEEDEFFGLSTKSFKERGFVSGVFDTLAGIYDEIVKDYVTDVYSDAIEDYTGATVKLIGWFFFGSFLVLKGTMLNWLNDQARSFDSTGRALSEPQKLTEMFGNGIDDQAVNYTIPYIDQMGLNLTYPVDNSLQECYNNRTTCVNNDFNGEVDNLFENLAIVKDFGSRWLELSDKIGNMVMNGESEL